MFIYSVHDNKAMSYMTPFFAANDPTAQRSFTDACLDDKTQLAKHPNDFTLYCLATYDPVTGRIEPHEHPTQIITAIAVINYHHSSQSYEIPFGETHLKGEKENV